MSRRRAGACRGLRGVVFGLAIIMTVLAVTSDPADARRRRHKSSYNPPFASIVVDVNSGSVLQATNADARRHPASLTKIMTLYLLFERLEAGKLKLSSPLKVSAHAAAQAPSKLGLDAGDTIDIADAIKALVTKSANDVAVVVAEAIADDEDDFAKLMTRKARALGMMRTTYKNASGLPDKDQITTARDQARLARAIQERFPRYYKYFSTQTFVYHGRAMRNHNRLLGSVDGVDGIKTGYTRASGFNLVTSMRRGGRHVVSVVLGGRSGGARDAQMRRLIGKYITLAATKRTATKIAEATEVSKPTPPVPPVKAPATSAVASQPDPGSSDPIKPLLVRTITVTPGSMKLASQATTTFAPQDATAVMAAAPTPSSDLDKTATVPAPAAPAEPDTPPHDAPAVAPVASAPAATAKTEPAAPQKAAAEKPAKPAPRKKVVRSGWIIQVGAFTDENEAKEKLESAKNQAKKLLGDADPFTESVVRGDTTYYRARFAGLDKRQAHAACRYLKRNDFACMAIKN